MQRHFYRAHCGILLVPAVGNATQNVTQIRLVPVPSQIVVMPVPVVWIGRQGPKVAERMEPPEPPTLVASVPVNARGDRAPLVNCSRG